MYTPHIVAIASCNASKVMHILYNTNVHDEYNMIDNTLQYAIETRGSIITVMYFTWWWNDEWIELNVSNSITKLTKLTGHMHCKLIAPVN